MSDELNDDKIQGSNINQEDNIIKEGNSDKVNDINLGSNNSDSNLINQEKEGQINSATPYSFWAEQMVASTPNIGENTNQIIQDSNRHNSNTFDMSSGKEDKKRGNKKSRKRGHFKNSFKFILVAAIFGVIAGASFIGFNAVYYKINPNAAVLSISFGNKLRSSNDNKLNLNPTSELNKTITTTTVSNDVIQQETDVTDVVEATMPSIVTITSTYAQSSDWFGQQAGGESEGGGSGIIVGKNETELLIATNNHVVENADPIKVTFTDGTQAVAIIKGTDATADLAVVSIDISSISKKTLAAIKIANLGDSESVKVGQMAIAIGNALGYGQSLTVGYISAKDREVVIADNTMVLLQTDAAINPGNSGGALLNIKGEVIGINSVKYAASEVEGMGYAIPISRALPIIKELMSREIIKAEEKGYLGVYINDVTEEISVMYNWPVGVYVTDTVKGGGAAKAGIVARDIITGIEGTEIIAGTQLREKANSYRTGTDITLTVMRSVDGKYVEKEIVVTLGKNPEIKK